LIGEVLDEQQQRETGRRTVKEGTPFQRSADKQNRMFQIRAGFRRRHPTDVLSNYSGVASSTTEASEMWEKSLLHETEKVDMPKEFKPKSEMQGLSNQLGIVTTAEANFKNKKNKLERMHLVGV
jgi:hypothetical protein